MSEYSEIYLAGGCFWGVEKYLASLNGVISTEVGYANGKTLNPTYQEVCYNNTGHAETVRIMYDNKYITLDHLLNVYFRVIDPTSINRQGGDVGTQYRTGIYYVNDADRTIIDKAISDLAAQYTKPIAIEVEPLDNYSSAEEYHQKYLEKNPDGYCHIGQHFFQDLD